jgi:hypothetical protein
MNDDTCSNSVPKTIALGRTAGKYESGNDILVVKQVVS